MPCVRATKKMCHNPARMVELARLVDDKANRRALVQAVEISANPTILVEILMLFGMAVRWGCVDLSMVPAWDGADAAHEIRRLFEQCRLYGPDVPYFRIDPADDSVPESDRVHIGRLVAFASKPAMVDRLAGSLCSVDQRVLRIVIGAFRGLLWVIAQKSPEQVHPLLVYSTAHLEAIPEERRPDLAESLVEAKAHYVDWIGMATPDVVDLLHTVLQA